MRLMAILTLPDGSTQQFDAPKTLGELLATTTLNTNGVVAARITTGADTGDETVIDLVTPITHDCRLIRTVTIGADDPDGLEILRHSAAHVLAEAVCSVWPEAKLVYGPPVEDGFYYDIDLDTSITPEDFERIQAKIDEIVKAKRPFTRYTQSQDEAMAKLQAEGNRYKVDNAQRAQSDELSFYVTGEPCDGAFEDLCRGPHLPHTGWIKASKVMSVAGAYYRGDASEKMLQRVYGTAWPDRKLLKAYLTRLEEAKKRDHRLLGRQLDLYTMHDEIGPGLVHWHPKGASIRHQIETFWRDEHLKRGYDLVYTPHIASQRIYEISGHLEKYGDMMYAPMDIDGVNYYLRPMNCPGHYMMYKADVRSYRDLPMRWAELGTVYRYEPSGTLHGMLRVRGFTQDDAHTFCRPDQLGQEIDLILELMDFMMTTFGYTYKAYLATRPEEYLGTEEEWDHATRELREAMERRSLSYEIDEGGGVFYAPKIDIKLIDSLGREWQGPTHQVDMQAAKRFGITYVGADYHPHAPVLIHRTVLGSMERFIGGLIEHFGGAFPMWLAPVQVVVATISEKSDAYAQKVAAALKHANLKIELDLAADKIGAKIRRATMQKVPYILVVGEKEAELGEVNVRQRGEGPTGTVGLDAFVARCQDEVATRALKP